jgi:hypothetical protein
VIAIDIEHFPLVLLDLGHAGRTPEEFRGMFAAFRDANQRAVKENGRYVLVAVTEAAPIAAERRIIVDESNRFSAAEYKLVAGVVLVIQNSIVRGAVTALGWMIPHIPPLEAAPTTGAAVKVAVARLEAQGVAYPPELAQSASRWFEQRRPSPAPQRARKAST